MDEWLRFRTGEHRLRLPPRRFWNTSGPCSAMAARIFVTLLIEPQVNPIKHFPVVTVSHKVIRDVRRALIAACAGVSDRWKPTPSPVSPCSCCRACLDSWSGEPKENWRLYEANRSPKLQPAVVGHHGETLAAIAAPRLPFRHDSQALCQAPSRPSQVDRHRQLDGLAKVSPTCRTAARQRVAVFCSRTANSSPCSSSARFGTSRP